MSNDKALGDGVSPGTNPLSVGAVPETRPVGDGANDFAAGLYRVGVRLPPFWPEKPSLWFAQVEGQFIISRITSDETKFYHVISQLDHQYAQEVEDVITNPPAAGKYEKLKSELVNRLSASREKKVTQLLMHEELGDRKPSQFLRHLRNLAGSDLPDSYMRTIWSSRLPRSIQTVIASQMDSPLETVAELADKINEIAPATPQVASTSTADPVMNATLFNMAKQVTELARQVSALTAEVRAAPRARSHSRSGNQRYRRDRSKSRTRNDNYCWYHNRFGSIAHKCIQPCRYSENYQGSQK